MQGGAIGGGLGLAMSADSGSPPRRPGSPPFARLGFHQGFALSVTLPRAVGPQPVQDLLLTGLRVSGEEAASIGLCDAVADDPREAAVELATAIAASAPLSVPSIWVTLRRSLVSEVSAALDLEADAQAALLDMADFAEGIAASIGKRPPHSRVRPREEQIVNGYHSPRADHASHSDTAGPASHRTIDRGDPDPRGGPGPPGDRVRGTRPRPRRAESSVHGFIRGLLAKGRLYESDRGFYLGPAVYGLTLASGRIRAGQVSQADLDALHKDTGMTVFLGVEAGDHLIYIGESGTDSLTGFAARSNIRRQLISTAGGRPAGGEA